MRGGALRSTSPSRAHAETPDSPGDTSRRMVSPHPVTPSPETGNHDATPYRRHASGKPPARARGHVAEAGDTHRAQHAEQETQPAEYGQGTRRLEDTPRQHEPHDRDGNNEREEHVHGVELRPTKHSRQRYATDAYAIPTKPERIPQQKYPDDSLTAKYLAVLQSGDVNELRRYVLLNGMPANANELGATGVASQCSLRGLVWKALLKIGTIEPDEYADLVRRGPSADDRRVREDARRTFSKNDDFCARVPNAKIIRLLNAYGHATGNIRGVYAQSMSLLAAPFLYVMPEPDAFHCFRALLTQHVPQYVKRYYGARKGCELLDRCLEHVDADLYNLFQSHQLNAEVYAFPSISSLGACVPPMSDTVRLWDVQLAFGAHMHILFTLSRLLLASPSILAASEDSSAAPLITRQLEQGLGVNAETVLARAIPLVNEIEPSIYAELVSHATTPQDHPQNDTSLPEGNDDHISFSCDDTENFTHEASPNLDCSTADTTDSAAAEERGNETRQPAECSAVRRGQRQRHDVTPKIPRARDAVRLPTRLQRQETRAVADHVG